VADQKSKEGFSESTSVVLERIFSTIIEVLNEPVQGASPGSILGGNVDLGKGIIGLFTHPVTGTIDLVTQTTKGSTENSRTIHIGISKMCKKVPAHNPNEPDQGI